jgi:hypothetical protein
MFLSLRPWWLGEVPIFTADYFAFHRRLFRGFGAQWFHDSISAIARLRTPRKKVEIRLKSASNSFALTTLRNKSFVINGMEKIIGLYPAKNKAFKPKTPVGVGAVYTVRDGSDWGLSSPLPSAT